MVLPAIMAVMAVAWVREEAKAVQDLVVRVLALLRAVKVLSRMRFRTVVGVVTAMPAAAVAGRRVSLTAVAAAVAAAAA
jgi:hypothetical protein